MHPFCFVVLQPIYLKKWHWW